MFHMFNENDSGFSCMSDFKKKIENFETLITCEISELVTELDHEKSSHSCEHEFVCLIERHKPRESKNPNKMKVPVLVSC